MEFFPFTLDIKETRFLDMLFLRKVVKFGRFWINIHEEYPELPPSPIYIDFRALRSFPNDMIKTVDLFKGMINNLMFHYLADIPTSASYFVSILSYLTKKPIITPRLSKKSHGIESGIDGVFERGKTVVVIDDVLSSGTTILKAIKILEENGLKVKDIVVLLDRDQGGAQFLARYGYKVHRRLRLSTVLKYYLYREKITQEQFNKTMEFLDKAKGVLLNQKI